MSQKLDEGDGNGDFVTFRECGLKHSQVLVAVSELKIAIFGSNGRGGLIGEVSTLSNSIDRLIEKEDVRRTDAVEDRIVADKKEEKREQQTFESTQQNKEISYKRLVAYIGLIIALTTFVEHVVFAIFKL